jgi:hypothetical protein
VCPGAGCRVVLVCVRNGRIDVHLRRQVSNSWEKGLMGFQMKRILQDWQNPVSSRELGC